MTETLTIIIFIFTYLTIAVQKIPVIRIDRPSGVLAGSTLLILVGSITLKEAYTFIDWDVITFLMGMMIMTAYLEHGGFFPLAARYIVSIARTGRHLLVLVILSTAVLSALFVNDTICLLFTPMLLAAARALKINPVPYLLAVATSSNIGSALTVTGNPQNMYIGIVSQIPFLYFMTYTALPVIFGLGVVYLVISRIYKKDIGVLPDVEIPHAGVYDKVLIIKALATLGITLILFLFHVSYPFAALIGATIIILTGRVTPRVTFARVDWQLLIFFAGLFVVMGALGKTSYMAHFIESIEPVLNSSTTAAVLGIGGITLVLSNVVSNLPAVIMMYPIVAQMEQAQIFTVYLALISTFAGNLTLVGSVANIIVVEKSRQHGVEISFFTHFKAGALITLLSAAFATAYIIILLKM